MPTRFSASRFAPVALAAVTTAVALTASPSLSVASNYPPDYVIDSECKTQGPVQVCALNRRYGNYPRLVVHYDGYLEQSQWGRLASWVKLNGRTGTFGMTNLNYEESLYLGDVSPYMCWVGDSLHPETPPPAGQYGACSRTPAVPGGGGLQWEVSPATPEESAVLFYARDENGRPNAWDVEVAFVAQDGRWDSNYGANYTFRFE